MIAVKCEWCGKSFDTYPCRIKRGESKFCSKACYSKSLKGKFNSRLEAATKARLALPRKRTSFTCAFCGKTLLVQPCMAKKYCSRACADKELVGNTRKNSGQFKSGRKNSLEVRAKISKANKDKPKPWFRGKPISDERKARQSDKLKGKMPANMQRPGKWGNIKRGYFFIDGNWIFLRSKWEANYACYLTFLREKKEILKWDYEADSFVFEAIKFGTRSYRPDFKVWKNSGDIVYHEVKGKMTAKSKTQLKRMKKYYPAVEIELIDKGRYGSIAKWASVIPGWGQEPMKKPGGEAI